MIDAEVVDPAYRFESTVEGPDGVRVTVTTHVPAMRMSLVSDKELGSELAEITQMGASQTAVRAYQAFRSHSERVPF